MRWSVTTCTVVGGAKHPPQASATPGTSVASEIARARLRAYFIVTRI
jgi:hypothetical protein